MYSESEILEYVEEEDVKFVRLAFLICAAFRKIFRLWHLNLKAPLKTE